VPPRATLLGGIVAAFMVVFSGTVEAAGYWSQSYWGGAVAAAAGALVFGALRRLYRRVTLSASLIMGLGLAVLANSRPYEGLIVSFPVVLSLLVLLLRKNGPPFVVSTRTVIVPLALIGLATLGLMLFYNAQTTGDPLLSPYQLNCKTYTLMPHSPHFFWQPLGPEPVYNHKELWEYYVPWTKMMVEDSMNNFGKLLLLKLSVLWQFYIGWVLSVPLLVGMPFLLRSPWGRFALATCSLVLAGVLALNFVFPHYAAPVTGLLVLLVVQSLRYCRVLLRHLPAHKWLPCAIVAAYACWQIVTFVQTSNSLTETWHHDRARFLRECRRDGGKHLIAICYLPGHNLHWEWVYNDADIDASPVVWARLMPDAAKNERLFEYFNDRKLWLLEIADGVRIVGTREPKRQ
jgi:hypothetical protein